MLVQARRPRGEAQGPGHGTEQRARDAGLRGHADLSHPLAAGGKNPVTGERVLDEWVAQQAMSVMLTCGMYDASGQWVAEVGVPAKSGVSGALLGAVPGALGLSLIHI